MSAPADIGDEALRRAVDNARDGKIRATLTLDADLVAWARREGLNLSGLVSSLLREARRVSEDPE